MCAEQHELDMLEELDRMHEECAMLHDDSRVIIHMALLWHHCCHPQCNFAHLMAASNGPSHT